MRPAPLALALLCLLTAAAARSAVPRELVLLNWSEYIDPALVEAFERQHGAKVRQVYFESDDLRDALMIETEAAGYDLVMVNGASMQVYRSRGWLAPVTAETVPNLGHVDRRWIALFPESDGYGVPYFWGTLGIAYRADLVGEPVERWMQLFRPPEAWRGRIAMIENSRDVIGMALKAIGHSANSADPAALAAVDRLLQDQLPYLKGYEYIALDEGSSLVTGDVVATMIFNGDARMVAEHHPEIRFVVPAEGTNLWVDYLTVTAGSRNKELAYAFIDFLNEPENARRLAEFVHYASPNRAAEALLPADFRADPAIYPPPGVIDRSEAYTALPLDALRIRNDIFLRLTR